MAIIPRNFWLPKPLHIIRREINYIWNRAVERPLYNFLRPVVEPVQDWFDKNVMGKQNNFTGNSEYREERYPPNRMNMRGDRREGAGSYRRNERLSNEDLGNQVMAGHAAWKAKWESDNQQDIDPTEARGKLSEQAELISRHLESSRMAAGDFQKVQTWQASTEPKDKTALLKMAEKFADNGFFNTGYFDNCETTHGDGDWIDTSAESHSRPWINTSQAESDAKLINQVATDCLNVIERLGLEDLRLAKKSLTQTGKIIDKLRDRDQLAASTLAKDFLQNGEVERAIKTAEAGFYKAIDKQQDRAAGKHSGKVLDKVARKGSTGLE